MTTDDTATTRLSLVSLFTSIGCVEEILVAKSYSITTGSVLEREGIEQFIFRCHVLLKSVARNGTQ